MKKKSASQSAFFNLRVLIGLFIVLAGVFLALAGFNVAQAQQKNYIITNSHDPLVPNGFDCSKIHELGIDRQENMRAGAIMIACGQAHGGEGREGQAQKGQGAASPFSSLSPVTRKLLAPLAYGATDVDLVTGPETYPNVTQSETFTTANPDNPLQIVVAFNDSRGRNDNPINISGAATSTDGGTTFTRLTCANNTPPCQIGQSPFSNTVGDPVILYNKPTATWFTVWLDDACGGQGIGGYKSTNPPDPNSWTHYCIYNEGSSDRESGWADNNPSSPHYGNMYVSWNDFAIGSGALRVAVSTDHGSTWTPITISNTSTFIRDVQITGDSATGDVYIAGMNEGGGGFPHNDNNLFFKSTDGGATWANTYTGPIFPGPGVIANGYFACMFPDNGGYWRHEGWGEPAVINHVVHYVYAQHGAGSDAGDVMYIRSTDGGVTFSAPLQLNTDGTTRPQWEPNLSVSPTGTLFATWYDGRESTTCTYGDPAQPCYRMWSRKSNDNGVSWLPDDTFSDVISPLPAQPDPGIQADYAGDYDYGSAIQGKHLSSWTDGRVAINSTSQQDAFTDRELVGFGVTSSNPTCGSLVTGTAPTNFIVNLSDPVNPSTVNASSFTVNGTPANSDALSNGNMTITFHFNSSPVVLGQNTMHIPAGSFTRASDGMPNLDFTCTFCYALTQLQVTSTNPPVGGTFSPPAPGTYTYDVNFNQAIDPASVSTSDLTLTGNVGGSVTNVTVINGNTTAEFTVTFQFGGSVTASIAAGAITAGGCNPNVAFSGSYTVLGCPPNQYVITPGTDTIVPGTMDTGNHIDDGDTTITLPFAFHLYDQTFNTVQVDSNGRLDFVCANDPGGYSPVCLPAPPNNCAYDYTIFPFWTDLRTDVGLSGCSNFTNGCGIFTSVSGIAPNRIFNIEWHAVLYENNASAVDFEARLYENDPNQRFEIIYGTMNAAGNYVMMVGGAQGSTASGFFTQDFCLPSTGTPPMNVSRTYAIPPCTPMASDALSRKVHGGAGTFDIPLPLTGNVGVECRSGGASNNYQMIVDFPTSVTVGSASVTSGTGMVSSFSGSGTSEITVNLTGVTDAQRITMTLHNVNNGNATGDVPVSMGVLVGDVNADDLVNSSDVALTKARVGQTVTSSNFREDVNADGLINSTDVALVKSDVGTALPP